MLAQLLIGTILASGPAEPTAPAETPEAAPPAEEAPPAAPEDAPAAPEDAPPTETDAPAEEAPPSSDAGPPTAVPPGEGSETPPPEEAPPAEVAAEEPAVEEPAPPPEEPAEAMSKLPPPAEDLQPQQTSPSKQTKRPTQFPRLWLGFGIAPGRRQIGFGVGVTYFVIPHLGIGLDLDNTIVFDGDLTYNIFDLTPAVTVLAMPRYRVSPLFKVGVGGEFISHGLGNYGRWVAQGGVAFKIGRRLFINVLVGPDGRFPDSRWRSRFTCGLSSNPCSLGLVIDLGIGFGF